MINKNRDSINLKTDNILDRMIVPNNLYQFYDPKIIIKIGKPIGKNKNEFYLLNNLIFKIRDEKIIIVYYAIESLLKNPNLLQ